jgi:arylformamidase
MAARWPRYRARLPIDVVRGGVAVSGLYDMEPIRHTPYLNKDLGLTPERVAPLSPLYMTPATGAPLITAVGGDESDEFRRHNREIGIAWAHNLREDVPLPGANHFTACEHFAEPGHRLFEATAELCLD